MLEADDLFGFSGKDLVLGVQKFASGVLAPAIWDGYRRAGQPMCIAASEAGQPAVERACQFVRGGGQLMLDSGAFIYRGTPDAMPWDRVLSVYEKVALAASVPVCFILPDVVGSQEGSLQALRSWGNRVMDVIGPDHEALLPVQNGDQSPAGYVAEAIMCLKRPISGLALPSNAAAFPAKNIRLLADIPTSVPHRLHFLGISRNSRGLQERLYRLKSVWPDARVSTDACCHRALVGKGMPVTVARSEVLEMLWDSELDTWDETEDQKGDAQVLAAIRSDFPHLDEDQLNAVLCSQMGSWAQLKVKHEVHLKENGPVATTESIYAYATGGLESH